MRKLLMMIVLVMVLASPVSALELEAPEVPSSAARYMPVIQDNLGTAFLGMLRDAVLAVSPSLKEAAGVCLAVFCGVLVLSVLQTVQEKNHRSINLIGTVVICTLIFGSFRSFINLATDTVSEISEYGKLLLPVMTAALAAQGGAAASAALYGATAIFDSLLTGLIAKVLTPMIYLFLALAAAKSAVGDEMLKRLGDQMKGFMTWMLKTVLYVYTGYISITGVISGATDAAALKAAKLMISGAVPVVGGILSDASEAVLVSAGTVKNVAGVYGMFAVLAIWIGPFIRIGFQYLLLKTTGSICSIFSGKEISGLIADFSAAMGFLVAITGTVCLMLLISLVCFMKGVG